jgi:hypothetical protein
MLEAEADEHLGQCRHHGSGDRKGGVHGAVHELVARTGAPSFVPRAGPLDGEPEDDRQLADFEQHGGPVDERRELRQEDRDERVDDVGRSRQHQQ